MELWGIDILMVLLVAAFVTFWGAVAIGFVVYYDKNPYVPRKYYTVKLEDKDGNELRKVKGWIVTTNKVKFFRIGLRDFPGFKGIEKDIATMECKDEKGEIVFIEDVPDKYQENNYTPKFVPITQTERFITEITNSISEEGRGAFEVKVREALHKYSRLVDLNTSGATKEYIGQARREAERVKGDDFITKYGPTIILIFACLFAYLILDGAQKSWQATSQSQLAQMDRGYSQLVSQCGGIYQPIAPQQQNATQQQQQGVKLPFT